MFDSKRLCWPTNGDINSWADFAETLCLLNKDRSLSLDDFQDFLKDDATKTLKQILSAINFDEKFLAPLSVASTPAVRNFPVLPKDEEDAEDEELYEEGEDEFGGNDEDNKAKEDLRSRLLTLFQFLGTRKGYFKDYYPFELSENGTLISATCIDQQSILQKLYQVLLFSSEMHLYTPRDINEVGHLFEALCKKPFSQLLPAVAEKRFFGAGGGKIIKADYEGNLKKRIELLAQNLNIKSNRLIDDPDELSPTGDAGLDWVGWIDFEDKCNHQPVYFGQCACGSNWVDKQHETSLSRWRNYLELNQSVQCFHFMPRSFRRTSLEWFKQTKIDDELTLIDRYRLLKMFSLEDLDILTQTLEPYTAILLEAEDFNYADN